MNPAKESRASVGHRAIEALQEREHQLAEAQRVARTGSWTQDLRTGEIEWSDECYRLLGRNPGEGPPGFDLVRERIHRDHRDRLEAFVSGAGASREDRLEFPLILGDGAERWLEVVVVTDLDIQGRAVRVHGIVRDVTEAHHISVALQELSGRFRALTENTSDILTILGADGSLAYSSPSASRILGYPRHTKRGTALVELIHPDDVHLVQDAIARLEANPDAEACVTIRLAHADGSWRQFESKALNLLADPDVRGFLVTSRDITERHSMELRLRHEALHDGLTGLANRVLMKDLVTAALARARRRGWTTMMLVVDIDDFRDVNDRYGLDAGDRVLVELAKRLESAFRTSDGVSRSAVSVGRFAGDEFMVLCEQVGAAGAVGALWDRVSGVFARDVTVGDHAVTVSASMGVSIAAPGATDPDILVHEAQAAVRAVQERGGAGYEIFDEVRRAAEDSLSLATTRLRGALENGELRLYFQPKYSLATGRIVGAEGLLRWEDPERGLVPPLDFIPLAESTGLIVEIGAWVIEEACRHASRWERAFPGRPPLTIHVNVSAHQFTPGLVQTVAAALESAQLTTARLGLEVTESVLMHDVAAAAEILRQLKDLGAVLAIDDFGTGYSSLAYLRQFDLHELKIDKSFVDGLGADRDDTVIVSAVIALAHALGLSVVAEGVETEAQADRLRSLGCETGQGYLFARPAPAEAMDRELEREASSSWTARREGDAGAASGAYRADRVLVVDDSMEVRVLARMSLVAAGFEVQEAGDGRTGVEMATEIVPDCILLDVMMPELSGIDACRRLRQAPATAACTIIMLTANADAQDKVQAFSSGADDYIVKPFSPRDLVARVQEAMTRRAASTDDTVT